MVYLENFLQSVYTYIWSLLGIDFTNYTGSLPSQLIDMYTYVDKFFKIVCVFFLVYVVYNFVVFLISLGGIRK